jgi:hypothetical protein
VERSETPGNGTPFFFFQALPGRHCSGLPEMPPFQGLERNPIASRGLLPEGIFAPGFLMSPASGLRTAGIFSFVFAL